MTDDTDLFDLLERTLLESLFKIEDQIEDGGDLVTLVAVLSKMAADAAIDCGMDEEFFTKSMRVTYQTVAAMKDYMGDDETNTNV